MNCWRFDHSIFAVCRDVERSPRGEYELPQAVALALTRGARFRALPARGPVLDLSARADIAGIADRLRGFDPRP
jgi:glucose-1-phosphate thymidylyltransferase